MKIFKKISSIIVLLLGIFFILIIITSLLESRNYSYPGSEDPSGGWCDYGFNEKTSRCCDEDEYYCEARDYYKNPPTKYFETFDTSRSSFIQNVWYDKKNKNLLLELNDKKYWYCDVDNNIWSNFKKSNSLGTYYNSSIKGLFRCDNLTGDE